MATTTKTDTALSQRSKKEVSCARKDHITRALVEKSVQSIRLSYEQFERVQLVTNHVLGSTKTADLQLREKAISTGA